jgi:hypothetical protein
MTEVIWLRRKGRDEDLLAILGFQGLKELEGLTTGIAESRNPKTPLQEKIVVTPVGYVE